jgi:hypothetical protein
MSSDRQLTLQFPARTDVVIVLPPDGDGPGERHETRTPATIKLVTVGDDGGQVDHRRVVITISYEST